MDPYDTLVPIRIARLIYGFLNDALTTTDHQELDVWINLTDDNMEIFDVLTDILELDETGTPLRIIALIKDFDKRILTPHEYEELDEWINLSDENLQLFGELTNDAKRNMIYLPVKKPGILHKFINWLKSKRLMNSKKISMP